MTGARGRWPVALAAAAAVVAAAVARGGWAPAGPAAAAPASPLAACTSRGWQQVALPPAIAAQSLAVDGAAGRQRLYAAMYRTDGGSVQADHAVWAIQLDALTLQPLSAFDAATKAVRAIAVRPDSGLLAAGLSAGGVVHAAPDGALGAVGLDRRLVTAVEAGAATTYAAATDLASDAAAGLEAGHAVVWRQQADGAWQPLAADDDPFGSGYFWDLALDGAGRLWASKDGDGIWALDGAATAAPGRWRPVGDAELRGRTVQAVAVDPVDTSFVYAGLRPSVTRPASDVAGRFGLRQSRDGGTTWTGYQDGQTSAAPGTPFRDLAVPAVATGPAGGWVWASAWGLGLFVSRDAGGRWHRLSLPPSPTAPGVRIAPYVDGLATARIDGACDLVFATGQAGVFARSIADVAAEIEHAIYLPATLGAPWDILWPKPNATAAAAGR